MERIASVLPAIVEGAHTKERWGMWKEKKEVLKGSENPRPNCVAVLGESV